MSLVFPRRMRLAFAAALPLVFMAAQPVVDGMTYEFVTKTTSSRTGNKEVVSMRGRGTFAGDDAKIEILEAASSQGGTDTYGGKGTYFIVKNGGEEMLLVNPAEKSYMKWDLAAMMAGVSSVVNAVGGMVKLEMSDVKIEAQDMGAGPNIQGYATRHYRMIQNYTVNSKVFGRTSRNRTETTTDFYIAPNLRVPNPFVTSDQANAMMAQFDMFNNPDYKSQMAAANSKMPKSGAALRWESKSVSTDEKGKAETSTSVMEMINFKAGNIPASAFQIPPDYTKVEMKTMTAGTGGAPADSASAGPKPNVKDAAAAAAAGKLKGIFGGKKK